MKVGLSPDDFVRWGPTPPQKGGRAPSQFSAHFCCGQTAGCIKMKLGMEVGLSPGDFVLDGDPALSPKRGRSPKFSAHAYCGQTAGCIKMPLGTAVGLGRDDIVLDGDPATPPKRGRSPFPNFWPMSIVAKRLNQDGTWQGGRPLSRPHCVRWGTSSPPPKMGQSPQFSAHF